MEHNQSGDRWCSAGVEEERFVKWLEGELSGLDLDEAAPLYARYLFSILRDHASILPQFLQEGGSEWWGDEGETGRPARSRDTAADDKRRELLACLRSHSISKSKLNEVVDVILEKYESVDWEAKRSGVRKERRSEGVDSGVCPSPVETLNYDQAFPPLSEDDASPGAPTAADTCHSPESSPTILSEHTTIRQEHLSRSKPIKISHRQQYLPFTREWAVSRSAGGESAPALSWEEGTPRFVVHKCHRHSFTLSAAPYAQPPLAPNSLEKCMDRTCTDICGPRFILHHVSSKVDQNPIQSEEEERRSAFVSYLPRNRSPCSSAIDYMEALDERVVAAGEAEGAFDAELLVPSPTMEVGDPDGYCAPKVLGDPPRLPDHRHLTRPLLHVTSHSVPVTWATHFVPISATPDDDDHRSHPPAFFLPSTLNDFISTSNVNQLHRPSPVRASAESWDGGGGMTLSAESPLVTARSAFTPTTGSALAAIWHPHRSPRTPQHQVWQPTPRDGVVGSPVGWGGGGDHWSPPAHSPPDRPARLSAEEEEDDNNFLRFVSNIALTSESCN